MSSSPLVAPGLARSRLTLRWLAEYGLVFAFLFALAVGLQRAARAYDGDCGNHPDESAHFVTALLIHDYLKSGLPDSPIRYAERYYVHYPKVAIGMWPPVFHGSLALWMLLFGANHAPALAFLACIAALLAVGIYAILGRRSRAAALTAAIMLLLLPLMRASTGMVMADTAVALFGFVSIVMLARFITSGRSADAVWYGVFVTLASVTKANGIAFVLAAPLALLLTRRWDLLRCRSLYYAAAIFTVFGLPWQVYSFLLIQQNLYGPLPTAGRFANAVAMYFRILWEALGPVLGLVVLLGITFELLAIIRRKTVSALPACAIAAVLAIVGYHATAGVEPRYMVAALPLLLLLLPTRLWWRTRIRPTAVWGGVLALFLITLPVMPRTMPLGYQRAAEIIKSEAPEAEALFISSDGRGEGSFVASVAAGDSRPKHIVLRATKVVAELTWFGRNYRLLYGTTAKMQEALEAIPIDVLLVDENADGHFPHQQIILTVVEAFPHKWRLLGRVSPALGCDRQIAIYRLEGVPPNTARKFELQLKYTRQKALRFGGE